MNQVRAAVLVASDRASVGVRPDVVGPILVARLTELGYSASLEDVVVAPDNRGLLLGHLYAFAARGVRFIVTTGGTGAAVRDVTPDATRDFIERELPGFGELLRAESMKITIYAAGSRATAGTRGDVLVLNLPGSPSGAREGLDILAKPASHVLDLIAGSVADCKPVRDAENR